MHMYLEVLQHCKLLLLIVHLKSQSEKSLNAIKPQAVICSRHPQPVESECCDKQKQNTFGKIIIVTRFKFSRIRSALHFT